uniref:Si:ch211-63o20.7 n=1 Tax=Gasterosteus aculeatus TaxID=69293 RepID=G3NKK8_GASAC
MEELYTLEREVGRGSYGVVFEGHVAKSGQRVAIKRLPCSSPECIELYLQELWAMRATARSHANVIALHSCLLQTGPRDLKPLRPGAVPLRLVESALKGAVVGAGPTTPKRLPSRARKRAAPREEEPPPLPRCLALWLVMEYCDGGDLNQYLLSRPPDGERNRSVVRQLCSAVAFLHGLGITHRDLKPDNVLVCVTQRGPVVKVADFGLSKVSGSPLRGEPTGQHFSSTCGSDFFMAPEVWVYSAGLQYLAQAGGGRSFDAFFAHLVSEVFLQTKTGGPARVIPRNRWTVPLGEALWENADLQLCIPMKLRRAPQPPPPSPALSALLLDMLASDPDAPASSPPADGQSERRSHRGRLG